MKGIEPSSTLLQAAVLPEDYIPDGHFPACVDKNHAFEALPAEAVLHDHLVPAVGRPRVQQLGTGQRHSQIWFRKALRIRA
jgi:hypothetical protein